MLAAMLVAGLLDNAPIALVQEVSRAMAQERDVQVRVGTSWIKRGREWDVQDPAQPSLTKEEEFRVWRTPDGVRQILVRRNGRPVMAKPKPPDTDLSTLEPDRYTYQWNAVREQQIDGHPCLVLDFSPRDPLPHASGIAEEIALRLMGTIWIDRERLFVRRVEARLSAPFHKKLFGALYISDARAVLTNRIVDGRVVPDHSEMTVHHSLIGIGNAVRTEYDYSGFSAGFVPPSR